MLALSSHLGFKQTLNGQPSRCADFLPPLLVLQWKRQASIEINPVID